ncbi:MAG TPA: hypothetical protein VD840_11770 [Sinorhizobium sp.]|nr:hypothetical protein [Sinorhizobium sp.]
MKKLLIAAMTAAFALTSYVAVAADKKPTAEQCKKDPKMKGCEKAKK